jgi:Undecaprenyl-phosphate galactose phosphotransferase WbaP
MSTSVLQPISTAPSLKVTNNSRLTGICLIAADAVAVMLVTLVTLLAPWHESWREVLLQGASTLMVFAALGMYPGLGLNPAREFRDILVGSAVSGAFTAGALFYSQSADPSVYAGPWFVWAATFALVIACRSSVRGLCSRKTWWGTPVVIFGSGETARAALRHIQTHPSMGLRVVAVLDECFPDWPELGRYDLQVRCRSDAPVFAARHGISHAIVALSDARGGEIRGLLKGDARHFRHLLIIPDLAGLSSLWVETSDVGGLLGLKVCQRLMDRGPRTLKRACDIFVAAAALAIFLPVIILLVAAIKLSSTGPLLYRQWRIGQNGGRFEVWKFRTMCEDADQILLRHLERDPELRGEWERDHKLRKDPRVTSVGRFLRKTSLDELPQLWNVLKGEMSIVGPRPIVAAETPRYGDALGAYHSVRPGITGMWQVSGRNNTSYSERIRFDEYYVNNWSIWLDLYIIGRTFKTVLLGEGAY